MQIVNQITTVDTIRGKNRPKYLIIHDTASQQGTTFKNLLKFFQRKDEISIHYTVDYDGTIVQLADEKDVCFHAGVSQWDNDKNLNYCSIGIEVFHNGSDFTEKQRQAVLWLTKDIIARNGIKSLNVLRHADVAWPRGRKSDIKESFYKKYGSWQGFQALLDDPEKNKKIEDNEKILAQKMEVAQKALGEVNAARKYLCELKGIPVKLYKITE